MGLFNYVAKLTPFNLEAFRFYHVFAVVCIIYISAVLIKWSIKRKQWMRALEQFPGPPGHWLLGHATQFKQDGTDLDKIPKWGEHYPFAFPIQFSPEIIFLFVHHPSYVKPILATTGPKDDFGYRFLIPWIGQGLLVTAGQKWFRHRRLLTPGFHYDILKPYVNIMADSAKVMLDEQQQGLSDEAIRAEVDTFMFEGHDTTASGISWIFYSMACNPEHQQKCREEIQQVLMGKDTIEWEDLSKIPYTTMCIKESLRMYPPVPEIGRMLSKPITFFDGRTAPAGCVIGINIYGIHHNPTVWENPKVFDPLRFLPENTAKRSPHAFVPFSAGPRNCIGQNFAMNEMKVAVALTLRKYVLIKDPDHIPKMIPRLVLRSLNGIHLKIKLVEHEL
ncbi:cytochrome P450 4A6-like isoform X2 [Hemibagrus wyckioides]|uniref:cytochrome P450 4A6-like isoform X2 n=1 Tax=Hemibagrus wyckioides TaxID=337641 RepID=UPI00266BE6FA|nr:cytochrome P450 4A6-like isoform X2 [Hemibagrus wyckioides]